MKRWLNEPLVHFLVLGALLFGVYGWLHRGEPGSWDNGAGPVRITAKEIAFLAETWERQRQRRADTRGVARLGRGLPERGTARPRSAGNGPRSGRPRHPPPSRAEGRVHRERHIAAHFTDRDDLHRFYEANLESFQTRARVSFTQVFLNPETHRDAAADAKAALAALSRGAAATRIGDPFPLDAELSDEDRQAVAGQFGDSFANAVFALKPGAWHGPIASSFGLHLVRVTEAKPVRQLEFSEVEPQVRERWRDEHQRAANEQYYASLLKKYRVVVDEDIKPLIGPLDRPLRGRITAPASELGPEGPR